MLHIFIILLKILGCLLLFLLALLLILLFTPVRYRFELRKREEEAFVAAARVSWFLRAVAFETEFRERALTYQLRVLWFKPFGNKEDHPPASEELQEDETGNTTIETAETPQEQEPSSYGEDRIEEGGQEEDTPDKKTGGDQAAVPDQKTDGDKESGEDKKAGRDKKSGKNKKAGKAPEKKEEKSPGRINRLKERIESIRSRISQIKDTYEELHGDLLIRKGLRALTSLLKHILPRRFKGWIRYGFDDPALTGYVTGLAATCRPCHMMHLEPDFQEQCFEADCSGSGLVRPIFLLALIVWLLLDKNVRRLISYIRHR